MQEEKNIPELVKSAVFEIDPEAEVYLFGSRARGDFNDESDWDFLILTYREANLKLKTTFRERIYDIESDTSQVISFVLYGKSRWAELEITPLYRNVEKDGIRL